MEAIKERSMSESAMMREILTKSTLELLRNEDQMFNIREFFAPVKAIATSEVSLFFFSCC
jgi:hypothetical protein